MVLIGLIGSSCSGKQSILNYLVQERGFTNIGQMTSQEILKEATPRWKESMVFLVPNHEMLSDLNHRPFFLSVGIDAPALKRYDRWCKKLESYGIEAELEEFLKNERCWSAVLSRCDVLIVNDGSLSQLHQAVDEIDLFDPAWTRPSWDTYFMRLADLASKRSNCMKRSVGAVLAKESRVIASGYNGTARNTLNCNQGGCPRCNDPTIRCGEKLDSCLCLHAEENALMEAGRDRAQGSTLYCNTCPCLGCAKKIIQMGVSQVVYSKSYGMDESISAMLKDAGIVIRQIVVRNNPFIKEIN